MKFDLIKRIFFGLFLFSFLEMKANDFSDRYNKLSIESANKGSVSDQLYLGDRYSDGVAGFKKDLYEAEKWYRKAANQGSLVGAFRLGQLYEDFLGGGIKNIPVAIKWYTKAAEKGYVPAQTSLGSIYSIGRGVPKDYLESLKWFQKAADQGDASAMWSIGYSYYSGEGVAKDYAKAGEYYKKSALLGDVSGQLSLGNLYLEVSQQLTGELKFKNEIEGMAWLNIVSSAEGYKAGYLDSKKRLEFWEEKLGSQITVLSQKRCKELLQVIKHQ